MKKQTGFTLIEFMMVFAIVIVLIFVTVVLPPQSVGNETNLLNDCNYTSEGLHFHD